LSVQYWTKLALRTVMNTSVLWRRLNIVTF